eukprot:Em1044g1a
MAVIYFLPDFFHLSSVLVQLQRERDRQAAQGEAADNGGVEAGEAADNGGVEAVAQGVGGGVLAGTGVGGEE